MARKVAKSRPPPRQGSTASAAATATSPGSHLHLYSSARRGNASLKLLLLDYLSYHLFDRSPWLLVAAKSLLGDVLSSSAGFRDAAFDVRFRGKHVKRLRFGTSSRARPVRCSMLSPLTRLSAPDCAGVRRHRLPSIRGRHAHYLLEGQLKSRFNFRGIRKPVYFRVFAFVERELSKKFSVKLPRAPRLRVAKVPSEEGLMASFSRYIRSAERVLYALSQKPALYSRVLFIALLMLLRNLRLLLHEHEPSIVLVELVLLCTEAVYLTQTYLHKFCCEYYRKRGVREGLCASSLSVADVAPASESSRSAREHSFLENLQLLVSMHDACGGYKCAIATLCNRTGTIHCNEVEFELATSRRPSVSPKGRLMAPKSASPSSRKPSSARSVVLDSYGELLSPGSAAAEDVVGRPSASVGSSAFSDFSTTVERLLYQWTIALSRYACEVNSLLGVPTLVALRMVNVGVPFGVPVALCKSIQGANLSVHRDPHLMSLVSKRVDYLRRPSRSEVIDLDGDEEWTPAVSQKALKQAARAKTTHDPSLMPPPAPLTQRMFTRSMRVSPRLRKSGASSSPSLKSKLRRPPAPPPAAPPLKEPPQLEIARPHLAAKSVSTPKLPPAVHKPPSPSSPSSPRSPAASLADAVPLAEASQSPPSSSAAEPLVEVPRASRVSRAPKAGSVPAPSPSPSPSPPAAEPPASTASPSPSAPSSSTFRMSRAGKWKREEVMKLVDAINKHGTGKWAYFATSYFGGSKTGPQLKDKWCNLMRYKYVYQDESAAGHGADRASSWKLVDTI